MRPVVLFLLVLLFASPAAAQQANAPILEVTFEQTEAIPGEMLSLRLTVLVPTFMPKPPVWPSFETPNLLIRLPEGSTGPTSKRIDGETWSGVTRRYRISPMIPGDFVLPAQDVIVTYADPETSKPVQATLRTEPIRFAGVIPEGAETLDPFIAADHLELTQEIEGMPEGMKPGDSVIRTVTAKVQGVSPMFLPKLLPGIAIDGIAAYPAEPAMVESDNRGVVSGSRTERVTLVAEGGGLGEAPPVSLAWYNLRSGAVETASVEGFPVTVDGPPARSTQPRDWRALLTVGFAAAVALAIVVWLARRLMPPLAHFVRQRREAWLASERRAYAVLRQVIARRDYGALYPALDGWARKVAGSDPRRHPALVKALTGLGAARYGTDRTADPASAWKALAEALPQARSASREEAAEATALPPLNPASPGS
ncbi:MAG: BatD family protein [Bauldia sp.]|uniref:hypothetical protein n=1 Tax=Bauldia sp. TaxID=2575872 RepID=UPI001D596ADF|nr:hypothetical protein [Bauldia sp.]MCB1494639.1 BatD family protein [Bauldia sp.]